MSHHIHAWFKAEHQFNGKPPPVASPESPGYQPSQVPPIRPNADEDRQDTETETIFGGNSYVLIQSPH